MTAVPTRCVCGMTRVHRWREGHGRSSTRTQTPASDDEAFELLTRLADDADVSRSRLIEKMVGQDHNSTLRILSSVSERGCNSMAQGSRKFLDINVGGG